MQPATPAPKNHNKLYKILTIIIAGIILCCLVAFAANKFASELLNKDDKSKAACVRVPGVSHTISIEDDKMTPSHVDAKQCDTLSVINKDDEIREIAFGIHAKHTPYNGVSETTLISNQSFTVTLDQVGDNFRVHDHLHDEVQATFTVKSRN